MGWKMASIYKNSLMEVQLQQLEIAQRVTEILGSDFLREYAEASSRIQEAVRSPLFERITQQDDWAEILRSSAKNIAGLSSGMDYSSMLSAMGKSLEYQKLNMKQLEAICKNIGSFPYTQNNCDRLIDIVSQLSSAINKLDMVRLTSNIEQIYDQLSGWELSEEDINYDDIAVKDDGSLCYQDQCVTQSEISIIWNTFVNNCENLSSKAIQSIKDKAWVVVWIFRLICIVTTLGLYKDIQEHIYGGLLEARSHAKGWDKMYCIKKDNGAKVYSEANTKSKVLGRLDYEHVITALDVQPFWVKFEYAVSEEEMAEAWVATCNLIRYDKLQNNHMALLEEDH